MAIFDVNIYCDKKSFCFLNSNVDHEVPINYSINYFQFSIVFLRLSLILLLTFPYCAITRISQCWRGSTVRQSVRHTSNDCYLFTFLSISFYFSE